MSDYEDRLQMIRRNVPQLFDCPGSVLYIGARADRCDYIQELHDAGHKIYVLEVFARNVLSLDEDPRISQIWLHDIRDIASFEFNDGAFDFTIYWHGPEHIPHGDVSECLEELERITKRAIILGTPVGAVVQDEVYCNVYEKHLSYWFPENFNGLGYSTDSIGVAGKMGSCILAWKELI